MSGYDAVNPSHYKRGDVECIDAIKASMSAEAFKGYLKGNNIKYMWRYEGTKPMSEMDVDYDFDVEREEKIRLLEAAESIANSLERIVEMVEKGIEQDV